MSGDNLANKKFAMDDYVWVKKDAPAKYLEIESGDICGIFEINTDILAKKFDEPVGSLMYIVEAGCGEDLEVPEQYLEFET